jgi:hypothetical protein
MCPGSVEAPAAAGAGAGEGKSVCVMDAAGPLGHALVDRLLRRGYTVHAATYGRGEEGDEEEESAAAAAAALLEHLSRSGGGGDAYGHRLKVFRADPFDYHAIADAVRGCAGVFCMFNTPDDQAQCDVSVQASLSLSAFFLFSFIYLYFYINIKMGIFFIRKKHMHRIVELDLIIDTSL